MTNKMTEEEVRALMKRDALAMREADRLAAPLFGACFGGDEEPESSDCFYCKAKESVVLEGELWTCTKCSRTVAKKGFETNCTLCDTLIPEDAGFCNDPKEERTFCNLDCHGTFYSED